MSSRFESGGARVAVYGEIDPNLVDGSSVWLFSICQVLASLPDVHVTLLVRRPIESDRRFLIEELLTNRHVDVVDAGGPGLLEADAAMDELERIDRERGPFDVVVVRGQSVLAKAAERNSFDGRLWPYVMTGRGMMGKTFRRLAARSARLLCQTEAVAEDLCVIVPEAGGRILILPPMIPDIADLPVGGARREGPLRLVYSGKLAPEYCWLETVDAFRCLHRLEPTAELHVLGDKVHRPTRQPAFYAEAIRALTETPGLHWHGAVSRSSVGARLAECDLALSIRDPRVEAAREISTKVLEYGAAGLPVVLNRAPAYEALLGVDYPLFIEHPEDAPALLTGPAQRTETRFVAAAACRAASREFTFSRIGERLAPHLSSSVAAWRQSNRARGARSPGSSILIAGHDLKFTDPIREAISSAGAAVVEDVWLHHTEHDEAASQAALEQADVIFCEWCLGNAAWYSRHKRLGQRLIIRLHRVEVETDHPAAVEIDNVDKVVFVSQHIADKAIERFGWDPEKLEVIPNAIDFDRFDLPKEGDSQFTLAMVGYAPKRKRLDRALDIVEQLTASDPRYRLLLVGRAPSELRWVSRDPDEVSFFQSCYSRIQSQEKLRGRVSFLPFSSSLPQLFQGVGFILSASDSEGHQVALAEGAASGAVPVVIDRPGASSQYPPDWIFAATSDAVEAILGSTKDALTFKARDARRYASQWSRAEIFPLWHEVLLLDQSCSK